MLDKADRFLANVSITRVILVVLALLVALGVNNRFIQDDAFISFRYAENFLAGYGLTWNIGDPIPVEGYTNFLWVMLMAGAHALGLDMVLSSLGLGLALGCGTLFLTFRLSLLITRPDESPATALLAVLLLGTNFSFSSYMTGGLETQLQAFLIVLSTYIAFRIHEESNQAPQWQLALLSVLLALAVMTRLDTALFCLMLYLFSSFAISADSASTRDKTTRITLLTLPGALIVGTWLAFKLNYYGDILPNTFYVKGVGDSMRMLVTGATYVWYFILEYSLFMVLIFLPFYFRKLFATSAYRVVLLSSIVLWFTYVVKVGGDFMEFRFMVPALPFVYLLIADLIRAFRSAALQAAVVALLLGSSAYHAISFAGKGGIGSIDSLKGHIVNADEDWDRVGVVLGELLGDAPEPVTIAVTAAGAVPYYSKLRTIDMLGLNDRYVARNGLILSSRPGHTRGASMAYLREAKVNLVLGHPTVKALHAEPTVRLSSLRLKQFMPKDVPAAAVLPDNARIVEIPLNDRYRLDVLYLEPHPYVDELIERLNLNTHRLDT